MGQAYSHTTVVLFSVRGSDASSRGFEAGRGSPDPRDGHHRRSIRRPPGAKCQAYQAASRERRRKLQSEFFFLVRKISV